MTKKEKRLKRLRQNPKSVSFEELKQVLLDYEFTLLRSSGSHHMFECIIGEKVWQLVIPFRKPHVKPSYVKDALEFIDEIIELQNDDDKEGSDGNE